MDLSPFAVQGGQSHFRGENVYPLVTSYPPRKSGQSPVNGYGRGGRQAGAAVVRPAPRDGRVTAIPSRILAGGTSLRPWYVVDFQENWMVEHGIPSSFRGYRGVKLRFA